MDKTWSPFRSGSDPDPRFTMANERTYLAWMRTATALLAAGLGVQTFATTLIPWVRTTLSAVLLATGGVVALVGFVHWVRAERALRENRTLPSPILAPLLAAVLIVCAVVLLIGVR